MRRRMLTASVVLALTVVACGGDDDTTSAVPQDPVEDPVVTIADMEFQNGTLTVEEGTAVTWRWDDAPVAHDVVFDDFQSPLQAEGTFTHMFEETGTYEYHCTPHPFMTGTITVVEATSE